MDVSELKRLLSRPRKISIITHSKPDGDALGSSLALQNYLLKKGHDSAVIVPDEFPYFLTWMKGAGHVINFEKNPEEGIRILKNSELIFCLDFNQSSRCRGIEEHLLKSAAIKVLIDHHIQPGDFCSYTYSYPESCATCELIYKFIHAMGDGEYIDKDIAECLYAGIMTDTGSFRFPAMTSDVHRIIANLMDAGAVHYYIHERIFDTMTEDRMRFLGYCLKDKVVMLPELKSAYIALSAKELDEYKNLPGDTEGLVNYPLSVEGTQLSALFTEKKNIVKISFRSKGNVSVRDFSSEFFNGGGHHNAAGGQSELSLEETINEFKLHLTGFMMKQNA